MPLRQPIVAVLGHVDHGKTTLLDKIRGTSVALREPGQITQWIGASLLPSSVIKETCGALLEQFKIEIEVPGLLFIDTPGHETFSNLRRRGGSAADIAVLVIDVSKGVEPQTTESLSILKGRKTPFVVAANKIDLIKGWKSTENTSFVVSFKRQAPEIQTELDNRVYTIMGTLSRLGFRSDRYDRITDFTKSVAIIPTCARTGEGIPELLAILAGLTQAYMHDKLETKGGPALGTVLEVKEEPGLGMTINAIIYDGVLKVNDTIVLGGREGPISTKVRALLLPKPLDEIRDPRDRFLNAERVGAASGVKIAAPNLDLALAGSALYTVPHGKNVKEYARMIEEEVERLRIQTDRDGVVLKTDTLGSLEAITNSLSNYNVPLRLADVGDVSKRDIAEAEAVWVDDRLHAAVLAFNVKVLPDAEQEATSAGIPIFKAEIIYHLIEDYLKWFEEQRAAGIKAELDSLVRPGSVKVLPGFIFRRSKPAVVGVEVLAGRIRPKYPLIDENGRRIGEIMRIQDKGKDLQEAAKGMQVAASIDKGIVGRNLLEGQTLIVDVPEKHIKILQSRFVAELDSEEVELARSLVELKRRQNPIWGL
ncbi:translation initiation factor IF-2 [[Eubacterium] cellulosolvens]